MLGGALCVAAALGSHTATPLALHRAATTVIFDDEFDGAAGSGPGNQWLQMNGTPLGGGTESNTSSRENTYLDGDGHLVIAAQRQNVLGTQRFTSGWLETQATYGPVMHVEARMKIAGGVGTWPLFWLLGGNPYGLDWPNKGEIDIGEEIGREPTSFIATLHGQTTNPDHYKHTSSGSTQHEWEDSTHIDVRKVLADDFHVYAADITANQITWYLDGTIVKTYKRSQLQSGDIWSFTYPMHVVLNLAIGGFFAGDVPPSETFPQKTIVDYVRVTSDPQEPGGSSGPAKPTTSCTPASHGAIRVTVTPAKGATGKGGTLSIKRANKVVQKKAFTFRTPVSFCAKPGSVQLVATTKQATISKRLTVQVRHTTAVSLSVR